MNNQQSNEWRPPKRLLLGPGPSQVHPRVLQAMSAPLIGHLDPHFLRLMNEIQERLRWLFQTRNPFTIAVSGTGSAAMEAAIANVVEPGDHVVVGLNGVFGSRMAQMVQRCGGHVIPVEVPWGAIIPIETIEQALTRPDTVKAVALVHAETSTGARQPLEGVGALCHSHEALLIVDAVTSLGGLPVHVDEWEIDVCYSATQKCLSCPPGLAPLTLNERAVQTIQQRQTPCHSWYLDCSLVADYWTENKRTYHHTAPISMTYALYEALRIIQEEGLEPRFHRHLSNRQALVAGLQVLGFSLLPEERYALPTLTCVQLPDWVNDGPARAALLERYDIEVGAGLGPLAGNVWRIGLMGESSHISHVLTLLTALEHLASSMNGPATQGQAVAAATLAYQQAAPSA